MVKRLGGLRDLSIDFGCRLQVPVGVMRVGVTEIGGERGHVPTDIVGSLATGLERSYREAMTEIVEPGTAFSLWSNPCLFFYSGFVFICFLKYFWVLLMV